MSVGSTEAASLRIREVTLRDAAALQRLLESNADYSRRIEGQPPASDAAREVLTARPPGVRHERKWDYGVWDSDRLVAFADVIVGWPQASTAHIGLLITDGAREGQGLGRLMHGSLVDRLAQHGGIETLRMGYQATGELKPYEGGAVSSTARAWARPLMMH